MKHEKAYTLIELMIVVAIIGVVAAIGAISISSRIQSSRLETAAMSLSADLAYARSAALFKGCHTRIVFCEDAKCATKVSDVTSATHYAILRKAQYTDPTEDCYIDGIDPSPSSSHFANWDYDKTPKALPSGVKFVGIYSEDAVSVADWSAVTDSDAAASIYFHSSPYAVNAIHIPLEGGISMLDTTRGSPAFQVGLEDCSLGTTGCTGYVVSISDSGESFVTVCLPAGDGGGSGGVQACF